MISQYKHLLGESPNPELADLRLERLLQENVVRNVLSKKPIEFAQVFIHIITVSNFLFHYLCRHPDAIHLIGSKKSELTRIEEISDIEGLRLLKYRELLRITSLDIGNQEPYEQILLALSELADAILNKVLALVSMDQELKWADRETPFALFAMGKLGARELNYSSDVDLIFVCANSDDIEGDMNEYHSALVQRIRNFIYYLEEIKPTGFLYRVDLNLRPWGRSAPLVMPIDDTENYYEASTEIWERLAWLRARFIAGSSSLGTDMLERLNPYIYKRMFGLEDMERFIGIKNEMSNIRRREGSWNVKTGEGGIRDIEFFIQILQIVNAKDYYVLKQTNTLKLLASMVDINLLDINEAKDIRGSYLFLRRLENRLQMIDELQVHDLPDNAGKRLIIARSLGFSGVNNEATLKNFDDYLCNQKNIAKACFDKILLRRTGDIALSIDSLEAVLKKVWHQDIAKLSLERWLNLCEKSQWGQCPKNIELLISLFGVSWYFTRFVFFRGHKIASFFDQSQALDFTSKSLIDNFMKMSTEDDAEAKLEILRIRKNEIMLSILLAQLSQTHTQEEVEHALTKLSEATLFCTVQVLAANDTEIIDNIAILAMGRMAGNEMNFGSDLDLIFLYKKDSQELAYKVSLFVRKLMRTIGLLSPAGLLYEIDTRLRPHGNSGVLATSVQSFVDYHKDKREVWERQMMTRCRAIIDNGNIANTALAQIESSIYQKFDKETLKTEISDMRNLVIDELGNKQRKYDLKRGKEGGIMDIDFLTHYLQLLHGHDHKSLQTSSTREALRKLSDAGFINNEHGKFLLEAYDYLKIIENHIRVFDMKSTSTFSKDLSENKGLVRSMNYMNDDIQIAEKEFIDDYKNITQRVKTISDDILH